MSKTLTRREIMLQGALYGGTLWLLGNVPRSLAASAAGESTAPAVLSATEWNTVEAITGRIIPTDHEPGAIEANCVNFIDKALLHEDAELKPTYQAGVRGIDEVSDYHFGKIFAELAADDQDAVLTTIAAATAAAGWPEGEVGQQDFFETVREHTVIGFLADPKYGGNRDYIGWKVVGYPGPRHKRGGYTPEQMIGKQKIRAIWDGEI
ncbi:MAG: gluconate 2-dehydrogenase subunit 3 family protein [Proteobacteria bacterium]|nr:MAG: gluconate 2-dehydrogenase subunit 3 family protein [Pseudomonadota bacterium]